MTRLLLQAITALLAPLLLAGCVSMGNAKAPIPTALVEAPRAGTDRVLVVVLPGRGDDVAVLQASGIAQAIQAARPDADVLLTGVSMAYYFQGRMPERLHDEVVVPARERGYRKVFLTGASMGGMGALLYDRRYPGDMDVLVLLAPYLGDRKLIDEITAAGGIAAWQPGPLPAAIGKDNYQREVWRHIQSGQADGKKNTRLWLAYGEQDGLRQAMPPLVATLPTSHVLPRPGGHAWTVWTPAAREIFSQLEK